MEHGALLPWRAFDESSGLCVNAAGAGFVPEPPPFAGIDAETPGALADAASGRCTVQVNRPRLTARKSFHVEISRARGRAELAAADRAALEEQLEAAAGERIAEPEAVGAERAKGREAGLETGRGGSRTGRFGIAADLTDAGGGNGTVPRAGRRGSRAPAVTAHGPDRVCGLQADGTAAATRMDTKGARER